MPGRMFSKYPGGVTCFLSDIFIYIASSIFLLICGILRIIIGVFLLLFSTKMRVRILAAIIVILIACLAAGYYYVAVRTAGPAGGDRDLSIIIPRGATLTSIADSLEKKGIIDNPTLLIRLVSIIGSSSNVKAGKYDFGENRSYIDIADLLLKGSNSPIKITFPEGLTYKQMASIAAGQLGVDSAGFVKACENPSIIELYDIDAKNLEGYLFPDTYNIYYDTNPELIVKTMADRFFGVFDDSMRALAANLELSMHEAVTMASLIEKETSRIDERRLISAVFYNRLKRGMKLQCDPTVIYAIPDLDRPLLYRDLEIDSPYNTYKCFGLPPGPIANPGRGSLEAAVNPADSNLLYFVANGEGGHLFAQTNRQHNNNRIKIKRTRRNR